LLLLDEPLGSLDRALRERLMNELRAILKGVGVTAITVTHDQQEAFALADRVLVMDTGRALQIGAPEDVYRQPASPTVARFLGLDNLLAGSVLGVDPLVVETSVGRFEIRDSGFGNSGGREFGDEVTVLIRPEAAVTCPNQGTIPVIGTLAGRSFRGGHYQVEIEHPTGHRLAFALRASPDDLPPIASPSSSTWTQTRSACYRPGMPLPPRTKLKSRFSSLTPRAAR
jgi:ABC-type Fe3+/spermidine/putrescine transport system ATPase subunit